ncbi:hypothetical protein DXA13_10545 [Clostridium sp. AM58-1XD]|nr:hypothetical protein DXA13_10545 [Clostridium sp. AM58-1XD]
MERLIFISKRLHLQTNIYIMAAGEAASFEDSILRPAGLTIGNIFIFKYESMGQEYIINRKKQ